MVAAEECEDLATYTFPFSLSFVLFIHNHFSFNLSVGASQHQTGSQSGSNGLLPT